MKVTMVGTFGLRAKGTMSFRALPMGEALASRGHLVEIVLPPWDSPQDSGRQWEEKGVMVHNVALFPRFPLVSHLVIFSRLLVRVLQSRAEVVHCFKPKGYSGLVATVVWFLGRLRPTAPRLIVDTDDWEGRGGWNEISGYSWPLKLIFGFQETWGLKHCHAVIAASRTLEDISRRLGIDKQRIYYVPNGVPTGWQEKDEQSLLPKVGLEPTVVLYTRFTEFRIPRLIEIWTGVVGQVPQASLSIIGEGLRGEEKELMRLLAMNNLRPSVKYIGPVDPSRLEACLRSADLAIYPFDDTLINRARCPVKLLQLLAAGLPVVADDVGQVREFLGDGLSRCIVKPGDDDAFVRVVVELLRDEKLRRQLGEAAQAYVMAKFRWESLVTRVEDAYRFALGDLARP